ncbi:MAG: GNAT family N-acetyltransferase [Bacteroidota bacterium]
MPITIRTATKMDIPAVYDLVKELTVYENEPDAVEATLEDYFQDFEAGRFEVIVADENGEVLGMMLYFRAYSTWKGPMIYLDDFVVQQSQRRRGIGQLLFNRFVQIAQEQDAKVIKWQVLDWNRPAIEFYKKVGATIEKDWWNVKMLKPEIDQYQE